MNGDGSWLNPRGLLVAGSLSGIAALLQVSWPAQGAEPSGPTDVHSRIARDLPPSDLLQFIDGSLFHGKLQSLHPEQGVRWEHPDSSAPILFRQTNLALIRFERPAPVVPASKPTCRFRFANGDEVFGDMLAIGPDNLELRSWFGGPLKTPRHALQSITFLSKGYSILYEGPASAEGWVQGKSGRGWEYRDGAFIATGIGTLGRDFRITGSSSIAFDLAWNGQFSLIVAVYTSVLDRFDYSSTSYMFYFSPGYVSLQRVGGAGAMNLGQAAINEMTRKNRMRMEIRANKEDSTLGLLVDDRLIQRWKDGAGFLGQGSGVVFFQQLEGPTVRLSNIKVAQWEGDSGMDVLTNAPAKDDVVYLVNRDRVTGRLQSLGTGTVSMRTSQTSLDIPLARVLQISMAAPATNAPPASTRELRAFFAGGGTVAFTLHSWESNLVRGSSINFGNIEFDPQYLRQLQFNLGRSKISGAEAEVLDQEGWDLE